MSKKYSDRAKKDYQQGKADGRKGKYDSPLTWYDNILSFNEERNARKKNYDKGWSKSRGK